MGRISTHLSVLILLNSNHGMIRVRQPVPAFFLVQMHPPTQESLYFKASEPLPYSLHRILSLVSGFRSTTDRLRGAAGTASGGTFSLMEPHQKAYFRSGVHTCESRICDHSFKILEIFSPTLFCLSLHHISNTSTSPHLQYTEYSFSHLLPLHFLMLLLLQKT